ncbi:MAG: hypothetical protein ABSA86_10930 [Oryzomonas sp.]|jgi:hypothetical protein
MSRTDQTLEERMEELAARVQALELRLGYPAVSQAADAAPGSAARKVPSGAAVAHDENYPLGEPSDVSEEVLNWVGRASLLSRVSTLCFLLVVALVLRTITDSGLVNKLVGSALGMGYAASLMVVGAYKYSRQSPLAPVFAACGALLMSSVVVETHTHFQSLPLVPAYLTLIATGVVMAYISNRFNAFTPISFGVLGMCLAGAAIDYPRPFFPYLSLLLLSANLIGYIAAQLKRCSWLRWTVLLVTVVMLQLWGVRIGLALRRGEAIAPDLALNWYFPVLAVFFSAFVILSFLGMVRGGPVKVSRFDGILPTLNVAVVFSLALYMVTARQGDGHLLGAVGVAAAIGHFGVALWSARRGTAGAPGTNSFAFAGAALLALALPQATGSFLLTLPVISLVAIVMAFMSRVWENGGLRAITYLFTIYCCGALAACLHGEGTGSTDAVAMLPAGLVAYIAISHYQWCRRRPLPTAPSIFSRFDRNDRSAVLLLLGGLTSGFYMLRVGIYQVVQMLPVEMQRDAFRCSQSVLINIAAAGIIGFAYLRRNGEIRNVAVFVTLIGGVKVFLYDLLGTHGLPLVFSVFSFGLAAAVESVALGKWQKQRDGEVVVP